MLRAVLVQTLRVHLPCTSTTSIAAWLLRQLYGLLYCIAHTGERNPDLQTYRGAMGMLRVRRTTSHISTACNPRKLTPVLF
jgi:hypothetical protein